MQKLDERFCINVYANLGNVIAIIVHLACAISLFVWTFINHCKRNMDDSVHQKWMHRGIFIWNLIFSLKSGIGIFNYFNYYRGHEDDDDWNQQNEDLFIKHSKIYLSLGLLTGFTIQTLFLFIIKEKIKNLRNLMNQQDHIVINLYEDIYYGFICVYFSVRVIFFVPIVNLFFTDQVPEMKNIQLIQIIFIGADSLIIAAASIINKKYCSKVYNQLQMINEEDKKFEKRFIHMSIFICFCRTFLDIFLYVYAEKVIGNCVRSFNINIEYNILYVCIGIILMQILPICLITYKYTPKDIQNRSGIHERFL